VAVGGVLGLAEDRSVICRRGNARDGSTAEATVGELGAEVGHTPATYYPPSMRVDDEIAALEESKNALLEDLKGIEARIQELQKTSKKDSP
jgi:hypothetical protein